METAAYLAVAAVLLGWETLSIVCHAICLGAIWRLIRDAKRSAHMLMFSMGLADLMYTLAYTTGLAMSVAYYCGKAKVPELLAKAVGRAIGGGWFTAGLHLPLMALNRVMGIFFPAMYQNTTAIWLSLIGVTWAATIGDAVVREICFCCPTTYVAAALGIGYEYPPGNGTIEMLSFDVPFSAATIAIPAVGYMMISVKLMLQRLQITKGGGSSSVELKLCWQFFLVLTLCAAENISFYVLPYSDSIMLVAAHAALACLNYSANPLIYFYFNKTIREELQQMLNLARITAKSVTTEGKSRSTVAPAWK